MAVSVHEEFSLSLYNQALLTTSSQLGELNMSLVGVYLSQFPFLPKEE